MAKLWFLLAIAFVDLIVAMVLAGRGYSSPAYLFLLMAALVGGYAIFSGPRLTRDARGRLQPAEFPYAGVLGAITILASAGYVAFATTRPAVVTTPQPMRASSMQAPAPPSAYEAPRSFNPSPDAAVIYKCVDARGHASFQSQRCPDASEQAWVRDATPEAPPSRAQLAQQARERRAAARRSAQADQAGSGSGYFAPGNGSSNPSGSSACQSARAADAAYRRQPLRYVTHDGLRQHGDAIQRACY